MSVDRRYWDSDAFLGWLLNERDKAPKCEGVLKAAEAGQLQIVTSALTLTEVIRLKGKPRLPRTEEDRIRAFFGPPDLPFQPELDGLEEKKP